MSARAGGLAPQRIDDGKGPESLITATTGAAFANDGGLRVATFNSVCDVTAPPAPASALASCAGLFPLSVVGTSEAGLWLRRESSSEELVLLARSGERFSFDGTPLVPAGAGAQVPRLRGDAQEFLPVLRGGRLSLEAWKAPPGTAIRSADDRVVFAVGGTQAFLSRRPAP